MRTTIVILTVAVAALQSPTPYRIAQTFTLGGDGGWDYIVPDPAGHRLFIGCRRPAKVLVYDTTTGKEIISFDTVGDTDDLWFDAARKRLYVTGGEGFVDVFQEQGARSFARMAHIPSAAGARTSLFAPESSRLYLAVPSRGSQKAEIRVYEAR